MIEKMKKDMPFSKFVNEDKINEIINYLNKEEDKSKEYKDMANKLLKMREKEHKATMATIELTKTMFKNMGKN